MKWRESSYISDAHFQTPFPIYSCRVKVRSGRKKKAKSMGYGMERQKGQKRHYKQNRKQREKQSNVMSVDELSFIALPV